jgi:hypothetical protein
MVDFIKKGCFGFAVCYSDRNPKCLSCQDNKDCARIAVNKIELIKKEINKKGKKCQKT